MKLPEKAVLSKKCKSFIGTHKRVIEVELQQTQQPVLYLAARQTGSVNAFFKTVANICKLEFQPTLPLKVFEKDSLVQQLGLEFASKYLFFPYYEGSTLVIATADPYPHQTIAAHCRTQLACTALRLLLHHHT